MNESVQLVTSKGKHFTIRKSESAQIVNQLGFTKLDLKIKNCFRQISQTLGS
jgi:hypothetical protein